VPHAFSIPFTLIRLPDNICWCYIYEDIPALTIPYLNLLLHVIEYVTQIIWLKNLPPSLPLIRKARTKKEQKNNCKNLSFLNV
jgi:hypothetical protein